MPLIAQVAIEDNGELEDGTSVAKIAVALSPGGKALESREVPSQTTRPMVTRNFKTGLLLRFPDNRAAGH